jgi:hypothetical protein
VAGTLATFTAPIEKHGRMPSVVSSQCCINLPVSFGFAFIVAVFMCTATPNIVYVYVHCHT